MRKSLLPALLAVLLLVAGCTRASQRSSPPAPEPAPPQVNPAPQPAPSNEPAPPQAALCSVAEPAAQAGTARVLVYFTCEGTQRPVPRRVPESPALLHAALLELLKGPTETERAAGFTSFFSPATAGMLQTAALHSDGQVVVDFTDFSRVIPNAASSAGSADLTAQINRTVFQFPSVTRAEYRFAGSCDAFWDWLQSGCHVVASPGAAELALQDRAAEAVLLLKQADWATLAGLVDPEQGVRFSPYAHVHTEKGGDLVFSAAQVRAFGTDQKTYTWGVQDGSGQPIALTPAQYHKKFIYDVDFTQAPQVSWDQTVGHGTVQSNIAEAYPSARFVEYHFPGFEAKYQGMDWRSLRLVFGNRSGKWYLVGVIHAQWTT